MSEWEHQNQLRDMGMPVNTKPVRGTDNNDGMRFGMECQGCGATHDSLVLMCGECHGIAVKSRQEKALATGPCVGCGERNHSAHHVSICASCLQNARERGGHMPVISAEGTKWVHGVRGQGAAAPRPGDSGPSPGDSLTPRKLPVGKILIGLTHFEAAMVLCVLAVAKEGKSQFDAPDAPVRRRALEQAYAKVSSALGVEDDAR